MDNLDQVIHPPILHSSHSVHPIMKILIIKIHHHLSYFPGVPGELCRMGVKRGPCREMRSENRTCDPDLSRHNNWCLQLLFISISERRIVFLPCWWSWQRLMWKSRLGLWDISQSWMREVYVAGFTALSVYLLMPLTSKVQRSYCQVLYGLSTEQSPRILVIQPIANCRALLAS